MRKGKFTAKETTVESVLKIYKQYASFEGRVNRQTYWMFILFYTISYMVSYVLDVLADAGGLLCWLFVLVSIVPMVATTTRRLHDIEKSGWWQILISNPIGEIVLIVFLVKEGTKGENKFGLDPINRESE